MIKKSFLLLPVLLVFTACSNKNLQTSSSELKNDKNEIVLSYNEYKNLNENKHKKIDNKPYVKQETEINPQRYEDLILNNKQSNNSSIDTNLSLDKRPFVEFYSEWKNVRYKMGGASKQGIDCSGFTQKVFKEKFGIELPRTTLTQVNVGVEVKKSELKTGDLVFFKTSKRDKHVGVYVGNGDFLHSSIKGIQFTKLDKPFYKNTYWTARRIID